MGKSMLKTILASKDISIKELAAATGLGVSTISRYVNGHKRPHPENAYTISEALGIHVDRVFPNLYTYGQIRKVRSK